MNDILSTVISPAMALLPPRMNCTRARAGLLAIQLQEDPDQRRRQWPTGPARGLWQFERGGGVAGVLRHPETRELALDVCHRLANAGTVASVYHRLQHDDILAACFARLLLWTVPAPLPGRDGEAEAWRQYMEAWRPGDPRRRDWRANFAQAWEVVSACS